MLIHGIYISGYSYSGGDIIALLDKRWIMLIGTVGKLSAQQTRKTLGG